MFHRVVVVVVVSGEVSGSELAALVSVVAIHFCCCGVVLVVANDFLRAVSRCRCLLTKLSQPPNLLFAELGDL